MKAQLINPLYIFEHKAADRTMATNKRVIVPMAEIERSTESITTTQTRI